MKRFFTLLLASCACMCLLAAVNSVDGIYYDFNAETLTATIMQRSSTNGYTGKIEVPATVVNPEDELEYAVTAVADYAFANCNGAGANKPLSEVDLSKAIHLTTIGNSAFRNSKGLSKILLPENLVSIGGYAFYNCITLEEIEIPQSVTTVGQGLFEYCTTLRKVKLSDAITELGDYSFQFCERLPNITLPKNLKKINNSLFSKCSNLATITIPSTVEVIESYAFRDCQSLTDVQFNSPEDRLEINDYAFAGCSKLGGSYGKLEFPEGLTHIGAYAFNNCSGLKEIILPSTLAAIGDRAFGAVNNLSVIRVKAITTPSLYEQSFTPLVYQNAIVYCVCGLEITYKESNTWWNQFEHYESEGADEAGTMLTLSPAEADREAFGGFARIDQRPNCLDQRPYYVISAVPNAGYEFVGWSDGSDVQYNRRLIVTNVFSLNATFKKIEAQNQDPFEQEVFTITYYKGNPITDPDNAIVYKTQKLNTGDIINLLDIPESVGRCASWSAWQRTDGKEIPDRISESFDVFSVSSGSMPIALHINRGEIIDVVNFDCAIDLKTQLDAYKETFTQTLSQEQFADVFNPQCQSIMGGTWTLFDDWIPSLNGEDYLHVNINSSPVAHKVTFVVRGKETVKEYDCDQEILFPVFTLEACEKFDGWYDSAEPRLDANGKDQSKRYGLLNSVNGLFKTDEDLTIYARFSPEKDTVRYVVMVLGADAETGDLGLSFAHEEGGISYGSDVVDCGLEYTLKPTPADLSDFVGDANKDDYRFVGWYNYNMDSKVVVNNNLVVFGAVVPKTRYTLSIYDDDKLLGGIPLAPGANIKEITDELDDYIFDKKGVKPEGWRFRITGEVIDEQSTMPAVDVIIESFYQPLNEHYVIFTIDGNEILRKAYMTGDAISKDIIPSRVTGISPCTDKVEWDLADWKDVMGVSNIYIRGSQPNEVQDTIFLHQNWAATPFDMIVVPCQSNPNDVIKDYQIENLDPCITYEGSDWLMFNGDIIPNIITSNIHVNINSRPQSHKVTFIAHDKTLVEKDYLCTEAIQFPIFKPEQCEVFEGWFDADGKQYGIVNAVNGVYTTDKDLTITARFSEAQDTVRYVVMVLGADVETGDLGISFAHEEGGISYGSDIVKCGEEYTLKSAPRDLSEFVGDANKDDYRFVGWYNYNMSDKVVVRSNLVIFGAVVPKTRYTLSIYDDAKLLAAYPLVPGTDLYEIFSNEELLEMMSLDLQGREFKGWRFRLTGEVIEEGSVMPSYDAIVEAVYEDKPMHDLIFRVPDGKGGYVELVRHSYYEGQTIPSSVVPRADEVQSLLSGCDKFIGWDVQLWSNTSIPVRMGDCDQTITAEVSQSTFTIYLHTNWSTQPYAEIKDIDCGADPAKVLTNKLLTNESYRPQGDGCFEFATNAIGGYDWKQYNNDLLPSEMTQDLHVNVNSTPRLNKVTFKAYDKVIKEKDYACNEQVTFPTVELKKCDRFEGWYVENDADKTIVNTEDFITNQAVTLVAKLSSVQHEVKYFVVMATADAQTGDFNIELAANLTNPGSRTAWDAVSLNCGEPIVLRGEPTGEEIPELATGFYRFVGWYAYPQASTMQDQDINVFGAVIPSQQFNVYVFNGSEFITSVPLPAGQPLTLITSQVEAKMTQEQLQMFKGWRIRESNQMVTEETLMPARDIAIEMVWNDIPTADVIFMVNNEEYARYTYNLGDKVTQQPADPDMSPCDKFTGWDKKLPFEIISDNDVVINAKSEPASYTIFLHKNWSSDPFDSIVNLTCNAVPKAELAKYDLQNADPCSTFENADGKIDWKLFNNDLLPKLLTQDIHVNINSRPQSHKVTFIAHGKTLVEKDYLCTEAIQFPIFKPEQCEVFDGWFDADGKQYGIVNAVNGVYTTDKDLTITARFSEAQDTVRYVVMVLGADVETGDLGISFAHEEGGISYGSDIVKCGEEYTLKSAPRDLSEFVGDANKDDYRFVGWYNYNMSDKVVVRSNLVIFGAVVPKTRYTLSIYDDAKLMAAYPLVPGTDLYEIFSNEELLEMMSLDLQGREFKGWRFRLTGEMIEEGSVMPSYDAIVEAVYEDKPMHDLIFRVPDGKGGYVELVRHSYYEGQTIPSSVVPRADEVQSLLSGCDKFIGWDVQLWSNASVPVRMGDCDQTITAEVSQSRFTIYLHTNWSTQPYAEIKDIDCGADPAKVLTNKLLTNESLRPQGDGCFEFATNAIGGYDWKQYNNDLLPSEMTQDLHVNVNSTPVKHNVKFLIGDAQPIVKQYVCGEQVVFPQVQTTDCQQFRGWYVSDDTDKQYVDINNFSVEADVTLVADIATDDTPYYIYFHKDHSGNPFASYAVSCGDQLLSKVQEALDKEVDWKSQFDACEQWDNAFTLYDGRWITSEMKVVADVHVNMGVKSMTYYVRFVAENDKGDLQQVWEGYYACDEEITLPAAALERQCLDFTGNWLLQGRVIPTDKPFVLRDYILAENSQLAGVKTINIVAQYKETKHRVRFHVAQVSANETGTISFDADKDAKTFDVKCGESLERYNKMTVADVVTVPAGFQSVGFYTYPHRDNMPNEDVHYFGAVVPNMSYSMFFFLESDLLTFVSVPAGYPLDQIKSQVSQAAQSQGVGTIVWRDRLTGKSLDDMTEMPNRNVVFQAVTKPTPVITFTDQTGFKTLGMRSVEIEQLISNDILNSVDVELPACKKFAGWKVTKIEPLTSALTAELSQYADMLNGTIKVGDMLNGRQTMIVANITVAATFEDNGEQFTISYHIDKGDVVLSEKYNCGTNISSAVASQIDALAATLTDCRQFEPRPFFTYYDGEAWIGSNDMLTQDVHVNINTIAKRRTLTFVADGNEIFVANYSCDDVITLPTDVPNVDCATFTGKWHLNSEDGEILDLTKPFVLGDYPQLTHLYADYLKQQHTIFYHLVETSLGENNDVELGKSTPYSFTANCGDAIEVLPNEGDKVNVPAGFRFVGWFTYPDRKTMPNEDVHYFGAVIPNQSYALMLFHNSDLIAYYNVPSGYDISAEFNKAVDAMKAYATLNGLQFMGWLDRTTLTLYNADNPLNNMLSQNVILDAQFVELPKCDYTLTLLSANRSQGTVLRTDDNATLSCNSPGATVEAVPNDGYVFVSWSNGVTDNPYVISDVSQLTDFDKATNSVVLIANFTSEVKPDFANYRVEIGVNDSVMGYVDAVVHFKAVPNNDNTSFSWLATGEKKSEIEVSLSGNADNDIVRIADFTTDQQRQNMPRQFRKVTVGERVINVDGLDGKQIDIFDQAGQIIYSGPARMGIRVPYSGHYILRIDNRMALIEVQ